MAQCIICRRGGSNNSEVYEGNYSVTPEANTIKTLETSGKLMSDNVTVSAVPYYSVDNNYGGQTVTIGANIKSAPDEDFEVFG